MKEGIQSFQKEQLRYTSALYKRGGFLQLLVICGERQASWILGQNAS